MSTVQRFFECNAPGVIFERFEDETVVINLDSGRYYTLDAMGAVVWKRLTNDGVALEALIAECRRDYEGDAAAIEVALREFVALLSNEQLVRPNLAAGNGGRPVTADPAPRPTREPFLPPTLVKYDDMAEMLLLDPVHDVNEAGWPSTAPLSAAPASVEDDDVSAWPALKRDG